MDMNLQGREQCNLEDSGSDDCERKSNGALYGVMFGICMLCMFIGKEEILKVTPLASRNGKLNPTSTHQTGWLAGWLARSL